MAAAGTNETIKPDLTQQARYTYDLARDKVSDKWKVARVSDYTPASEGQADGIKVIQEYFVEHGCSSNK